MDLPESGFGVFWILFNSWSRHRSCADTITSRYRYFVFVGVEWITGQIAGYSELTCFIVKYMNRTVVRSK